MLGLNEELTECLVLGHDLGHTPFGHSGERVMDELMRDHGGFEHNRQTLRILEVLEVRYPDFPGLNLTWEVREGIIKHHPDSDATAPAEYAPGECPTLGAQLVDFVEEIAYNNNDIDDGLTSRMFEVEAIRSVALFREAHDAALARSMGVPMRTIAVIPARWGSRGIPHKNFRKLGGRSLIRLAVDCALEAGCDRVIVTTDRPDRVGPLPLGVFVRQTPMALAGDRHQVPALIRDAILGFFDEPSDRLVYLQPSQPFRPVADVRRTIQACTWAVDGAATVVPCPEARTAARIVRGQLAWLLLPNEQRQRASPTYRLDGTCYVSRGRGAQADDGGVR